jgi:hypothetical protein
MKKTKQTAILQEIRRAETRIREISRNIFNQKPIPLKKRMFVGHWRFFKVRADILRSSVGEEIQQVVSATNHWVLGNKKLPNSYRCSTEVRWNQTESGRIGEQYLHPLSEDEMEKSGLSNKIKRKWFEFITIPLHMGTKTIMRKRYFPKVPSYMLEFAFKPGYITEERIPDGDLESELHGLRTFMETHNGWEKLHGTYRDEWDLSVSKKKALKKLREKELRESLTEED